LRLVWSRRQVRLAIFEVTPSQHTVKSVEDVIKRANAEADAGRPWRAKEILRGHLGAGRAESDLLEAYGRLLDSLGDRVEAGKYLFLSGARTQEYADAITLFRVRNAKRGGKDLVAEMPAAVRRQSFTELPASVQADLRVMGVTPELFGRTVRTAVPSSWSGRLAIAGALVAAVVLVLAIVLGLRVMASWMWKLIK
jgi:hypothetical protein